MLGGGGGGGEVGEPLAVEVEDGSAQVEPWRTCINPFVQIHNRFITYTPSYSHAHPLHLTRTS